MEYKFLISEDDSIYLDNNFQDLDQYFEKCIGCTSIVLQIAIEK